MTYYAGLDVSMKSTVICVVDKKGAIIKEGEVDSSPDAITKFLLKMKVALEVVGLETGPLSHHLTKELRDYGFPVECLDARHLHAFLSVKINKTDKNDARGIAEALRCGAYKSVHLKSDQAMRENAVINLRESLVETRVKLTNTIRGILKPFGIRSLGPTSSKNSFFERCQEAFSKIPDELKEACQLLLDVVSQIHDKIKLLDKQLETIAAKDEQVQLLMTAPGVGPIVALRFKNAIDDVERFNNAKAIGAYLGLTPKQYASGETVIQGRISRCGSKRARRTLVEAATVLLTRTKKWSRLKAWGIRLSLKKGFRKAVVAVARKLAIILYRMLVTGKEFEYSASKKKTA